VERLSGRWRRAVSSLKEFRLRVSFLRSEIVRAAPVEVAGALDDLCSDAEQADPLARDVLGAAVPVLADPDLADLVATLREIAAASAHLPLSRLLRRKDRRLDAPLPEPPVDERKLATSSSGRVLTLGERRALARRPTRAAFEALLRDPHPLVIRNLLSNPRLTEDDVVRLAARRPAYPEILTEIARHPAWSQRARVRMSIVQNPRAPAEIAVPMVRLLIRPELLQLVAAADVPAVVRAAATELLERRPPVPAKPGGAMEQ
jgi:acyl transferase domain-containing protein